MHILVFCCCCCLDELLCGMKLIVVGPIPKQTAELEKYYVFLVVLEKKKKISNHWTKREYPNAGHCFLSWNFSKADLSS